MNILQTKAAGAKPKLITSASESSSLPISELTLRSRATNPSKKSKTAESTIKMAQESGSPNNANCTAIQPEIKLSAVMVFGICFFMAQNILVAKTVSGMAMAVAAALDGLHMPEVVGTIAGDDTIMMAIRTTEDTVTVMQKINKMIDG